MKKRKSQRMAQSRFMQFAAGIGYHKIPLEEITRLELEIGKTPLPKNERLFWNLHAKKIKRKVDLENIEEKIHRIKAWGEIKPNDRVLSIASGIGIAEAFIAKNIVPQGRVICIDFSHEMSKEAMRIKARAGVKNLSVITADAVKIPLPSNSQDKVIAMEPSLSIAKELPVALSEIKRVLKKTSKARLFISFFVKTNSATNEIISQIQRKGFEILHAAPLAVYEQGILITVGAKPKLLI